MKKLLLVLGCYGFVVSPALAAERWSAETCGHLQENVMAQKLSPYQKGVLGVSDSHL